MTPNHDLGVPGVYRVRHISSLDEYIGRSQSIAKRWHAHKTQLRCGKHPVAAFQAAWDRDGEEGFRVDVLEVVEDHQKRVAAEARYIRALLPAYNTRHVVPASAQAEATRKRGENARKKAAGLCVRCPIRIQRPPAPGLTVCEACNAKAYARVQAGRGRKREAAR